MKNFFGKPQVQFLKINLLLWFIFFGLNTQAQITQTLRGVISDFDNNEPLEAATVFIPEIESGVTTDEMGKFNFGEIPIGRYSVKVSFVGYETLIVSEILLEAGKEKVLNIGLKKSNNSLNEVVVQAPVRQRILPSAEILSLEETQRLPATFFDPARLAFAYAGINSVNDQANHMVIRGNSPNNMSWRLEGVEIVNPNHLAGAGTAADRPSANGGGVNILSAQMLDNSVLMRGNFSSSYGNALSGIMDMSLRKGNNEQHEFMAQIGIIGTDLSAEGPISKSKGSSYLVNYRYSTLGLLSLAGVDLGDETITYQDFAFHTFFPLKKGGELRVFGMGGASSNEFETKETSLVEVEKDLRDINYSSNSLLAGLTYKKSFSQKLRWENTFVFSKRNDDYEVLELSNFFQPVIIDEKLKTDRTSVKSLLQYKLNPKSKLTGGTSLMVVFDEINEFQPYDAPPILLRPFAEWELNSFPVKINIGLSYSYLTMNKTGSLDRRFSLLYNLDSKQSVSLAYGRNSQIQDIRNYFAFPNDPINVKNENQDLELTKSDQISLGYQNQINSKLLLKGEIYYQLLSDVPVSKSQSNSFSALNEFNDLEDRFFESTGTGKNYGIEISAQQYISKNWFWLTNVSLYESKYEGSDGIERDTRFNGNYIYNLTIGKEFPYKNKKGKEGIVGVNTRITAAGGMRYTPIDEAASELMGRTIFDEANAYSLQVDDYFKSDLRVYWKSNRDNFTSTLALDIQNVTNRENPSFQYYDTFLNRTEQQFQLGLIPILSYRVEW